MVPLGEVITLHRGYDLPAKNRREGRVPIFGSSGVTGYHDASKVDGQNVITGRYGTIGEVFFHDGECWPLNTTLYVSDFHGNDPLYVAYLLEYFFEESGSDGGDKSAVPGIDRNVLHSTKVPYIAGCENQIGIVAPLLAIDEKIENNRRTIDELCDTAQCVYNYWFTQFDFPNDEGRPYRSSGGKMVWSEELNRDVPANWDVVKIGDVCTIRLGGTPDTDNNDYWDGDIPWLSSAEIATNPVLESEKRITEAGMLESATEYSPAGSVALSITRYIRASILGIDSCFNQSVVTVEENDLLKKEFIFPLIESNVPRYMLLRTGAQQPHINKDTVKETLFALPPVNVLQDYCQLVAPLYEQLMTIAKESKELESTRDWLLPMLISGQAIVG